jgi:adenine deaminase
LATAGGTLDADAIARLFADGVVHGLGEMMNFPGVLSADAAVLAKIAAARGCRAPIDGHAPGVSASLINAYAAAGIGSDHECVTADEARDRLRRGMYLLIREATGACNLDALLPAVTPANSRRVCFCTDDRTPGDLLRKGSVDMMVRRAIAAGIEPVEAIRMATLNPSEWFGLRDVGAIAPGRWANLIVFDDLTSPTASRVYVRGRRVAENGRALTPAGATEVPEAVRGVCRVDLDRVRFAIPATGTRIRLIAAVPDQIVTRHVLEAANVVDGLSVADPARDIAKMAVLERHRGTGNVGLGFVRGTGLRRGAIAGTVAHDHHNLVVIGCDDVSMRTAAAAVVDASGGLAVAVNETVTAALPLPVAGLMSDAGVEQVAAGYDRVVAAAKQLGASAADPFMQMSFLALEVIPSLKLTDQGLVDVEKFERVSLFV